MKMRVLELYSGIGGMHMALKASELNGEIVASIDINPIANAVYKHNFPEVTLLHRNIQGLTSKFINKLGADTILMSPPCQPFTRNGLQEDVKDERTESFKHLLTILPELQVTKILIENVKGFETSQMRDLLIEALNKSKFVYQEFILSPHQLGVPNTRHRYYCVARKQPEAFKFELGPLLDSLPLSSTSNQNISTVGDILEDDLDSNELILSDKILTKHINVLDICHSKSRKSCCFTKAYGRYLEGTGSVYTDQSEEYLREVFNKLETNQDGRLELLKSLNLRFFSPKEVCRLMSFPESFQFPEEITKRQKYNVVGNSVNVKVVSELIRLLK